MDVFLKVNEDCHVSDGRVVVHVRFIFEVQFHVKY